MTYYQMIRGVSKFDLRLQMVERSEEVGISQTAREYRTTRNTVRKWRERYRQEGLRGLADRSRAPQRIPHKTPKEMEDKVIELRRSHPAWGPERLKLQFELPISTKAIARIIRQAGLTRRRKKKWRKKRDLREEKKKLRALEFIQLDTKDLSDIEKYWPQMRRLGLPRYQLSARGVRIGGSWFAYAQENTTTNAALFAGYLLGHLKECGVDLSQVILQTDNGSEFIGNPMKKGRSAFQEVLEGFGVKHARIPPSSPTWNSDVETFHGLIEDEFYEVEDYRDGGEFIGKAWAYQLWFNYKRKNRWRGRKAPLEIFEEVPHGEISPKVFNLPPVIVDQLLPAWLEERESVQGGYHVGSSAKSAGRIRLLVLFILHKLLVYD